ncbi:hypothetical protein BVG16_15630 [Paenibacillus selenitireducens]|uniref:Major tropism determinant N-terminal domain-containing protein n=1 Tax=Paenibacillus selenitireducens TaxID=1324314 RepID=A0A1T2X9P4_9BACL|nr:hypothetical protein [Paenibacillus selenitireducens]OPA76611.1 hypothetical protein BVG16_15630 [Paenibacillus selenitireducens]
MPRKALIQIRRGIEANIGTLALGELGYCTDNKKLYIGTDSGNVLLVAAQTAGDMLKSIYDTNNDGKVDKAEVAESVPWAGITGKPTSFVPDAHEHSRVQKIDKRDRKPADTSKGYAEFVFTSLGGMTGASNSDYQDMIVLNMYQDVSGGMVNALVFDKKQMKILHYQAAQTATTWGAPKTLAYLSDVMPKGPLTWNQLKGV